MITFEYEDAITGIMKEVENLHVLAEKESKKALKKIGIAVSSTVAMTAPVSDVEHYYYKGQKKNNVHIADDVVYRVKKSRKAGLYYVSVSGGKNTWQKWHLANDGHVAQNGRFISGNHFVEKAEIKSEQQIESIIEDFIGEVIKD